MTSSKASPTFKAPGERAFFLFLTLVLVGTYVFSVAVTPELRNPLRLASSMLLLAVHLAFHWGFYFGKVRQNRLWPFLLVQGALALAISWLSFNIAFLFGAFLALIGESVGVFGSRRRQAVSAVLYFGALMIVGLGLISGWSGWLGWTLSVAPMMLFVIIYVTLYSRQTDAREQAQHLAGELELANRQLSEYAARVEDLTIAAERQRIARELHDTLSQGLAGLILQLEAADAHLGNQRVDKARAIVTDAMAQARVTLADARNAIDDLRQPGPDDLEQALCREAARFEQATGIETDCQVEAGLHLSETATDAALRIVSEALANVARHAQARHVALTARAEEREMTLIIEDDGVGFDPTLPQSGHYGLIGIRERARLVGGRVELRSLSGAGTTIRVSLPLEAC